MIEHLLALIAPVCPAYDGPPTAPSPGLVPAVPEGPHVIVWGGTPQPVYQTLTHEHARTTHFLQLVCVNNSPAGARAVADSVTRAVDGMSYNSTSRYEVTYATPPIQDRSDPTEWCWTVTVELELTIAR